MPGLDDYGALLRSGQAAVPDYAEQEARKQLLALHKAQEKRLTAEAEREAREQDVFEHDLATVLTNPNAQGYSALIAKHPKLAQQIKSSWDVYDDARQKADLQSMGEVYSAAANGKHDLAGALMKRRIDADKAAGHEVDPHDQAILDALNSGDPTQQKAAQGMIGVSLAAVTGPEKFEQTLGALTKGKGDYTLELGAARYGGDNQMIAHSPFIKDAEGNVRLWNDPATGDAAAPPAAAPAAIANLPAPQAAVASTLASSGIPSHVVAGFLGNFDTEGGYGGAKGDGGTAHGIGQWRGERAANFEKVVGKPIADASPEEQAGYVVWEMQHPEAAGMTVTQRDAILTSKSPQEAAAKIDQFYERSSGQHRDRRVQSAMAYAGGTAPVTAADSRFPVLFPKQREAPSGFRWSADGTTLEKIPGGPAEQPADQFRVLTAEEAQQRGLDHNTKWKLDTKNGDIVALGGQQRQAKQIPPAVMSKIQPSIDVRDTMARLAGTWRGDYGGHTILGGSLNTMQRTLGSWSGAPEGMANWWADFQNMDNLIRNQLFGSALTQHEKAAYAATTISPRMDPKEIVKRFNTRRNIINAVTARQQNFLKKNGYDPEAVDAMFTSLGTGEQRAAQPIRVRSVQELRKLPKGTPIILPDGRTGTVK